MRKLRLSVILLSFFLINCNNEPVDTSVFSEEEEIILDPVFTDDEGQEYSTGAGCVNPDGEFNIGSPVLENLEIPDDLPEEFDLSEFLPPIGNQGSQHSCVSWATGYYLKSMQEKIQNGYTYDITNMMSPAFIYNQLTQGNCSETSLFSSLELIKEQGICSLDLFPYDENTCNTQPTEAQEQAAENAKISEFKSLSGNNMVLEMKTLINQQTPILISAILDSEFGKKDIFNLTAYREHAVTYQGASCHVMLVVGYSDSFSAFKVVNSWGLDWGDLGFVWIDYSAFNNVILPDAPFKVITQAYVAYDE